ncbi:MAG: hypothetical protein U0939_04685 [Pirellulales bacterium]
MSRTIRCLFASLALAAGVLVASRPSPTLAQADAGPIPLHVAVERGLVDVQVAGRGASTGDSVEVRVRRKNNAPLAISVEPGTVIQPTGSNVQTMTLAGVKYKQSRRGLEPAEQIQLNDDSQQTYILEGYCRDIEKPTPTRDNRFAVQGPDADNAKVLVRAKQLGATVKVTQSAIWIQRSNLKDDELRQRFDVSDDEIQAARGLLVAVDSQDQQVSVDVQAALERLRTLAAGLKRSNVKRGDIVEVTTADATFVPRNSTQAADKLEKGQQLFVVAAWNDAALVRREIDGKTTRGSVKLSDVAVVKPAQFPVLRAVREAVEAVSLEVFDKVDVQVDAR